jgi:hypothetical protein
MRNQHKRKTEATPTLFDRLFKRSRTSKQPASSSSEKQTDMTNASKSESAGDTAPKAKSSKPWLEKSRKKEIKSRLNEEASREIRPLAVGTVAMMASALANQGELVHILFCCL